MLQLVTESISCMTEEDCVRLGVTLLPIRTVFGGTRLPDKIGKCAVSVDSFTMPPSEYEYYKTFYRLTQNGDSVLCFTLSQKLSNAYINAVTAAKQFDADKVIVIDSQTVAGGLLFMAERARELDRKGLTPSQIAADLNDYREKVFLQFYLPEMNTIQRSKRVSMFGPAGGPILNQKPVFVIKNGGVCHVNNFNSVIGCLKDMIVSARGLKKVIVHYSDYSKGKSFAESIEKRTNIKVYLREITASLCVNIGDEVLCIVGEKDF